MSRTTRRRQDQHSSVLVLTYSTLWHWLPEIGLFHCWWCCPISPELKEILFSLQQHQHHHHHQAERRRHSRGQMGAISSKGLSLRSSASSTTQLAPQEVAYLVQHTHFDEAELRALFERFRAVSASIQKDDTIELNEFQAGAYLLPSRIALGRQDRLFTKRIFAIFDENGNNEIDFREFCLGLSAFCERGTLKEKIDYSFRIYDIDGDGFIDKNELCQLLKAALSENMLNMTDEQLIALVDYTFDQVDSNGDGRISKQEYENMVQQNPSILRSLTINTSKLLRRDSFDDDEDERD